MKELNVLSLGAGVQSSVLALKSAIGEIPMFDCAIFADTGWEPPEVMEYLDYIESRVPFPVYRVKKGNIYNDLLAHGAGLDVRDPYIPLFIEGGGPGKRQCTADYKIKPINDKLRELAGIKKRQAVKEIRVVMSIGISMDEIMRCKPSRVKWIWNQWPLIDARMTREDCIHWALDNEVPKPPKSSCIGCPFHSQQAWAELKHDTPELFAQAVQVDELYREIPGMKKKQYMLRSNIPLREAEFKPSKREANQFNNECEGMCGV